MQYEIHRGRFDVEESLWTSFEADTDEEAIERLKQEKANPSNAWDNMRLIEVVVKRQTRQVETLE